jgi:hypothetical protein
MRKLLSVAAFLITACAVTSPSSSEEVVLPIIAKTLPDLGAAPELTNETWLNVDAPLRLADLRGKVVAIDMWTFG